MKKILIVDLNEILINSNILLETFWSAFSLDWKIPFKSIYWFFNRKSNLKRKLNINSNLNVKNLPYNKEAIDYITKHRKNGGYTVLVTKSNQIIARKIAKHLSLFDEMKIKGATKKFSVKENFKVNYLKNRIPSKPSGNTFSEYIKTIRAYQWIKNILVFVPMFAAHQINNENLSNSILAFIAFSLIASCIYIINDLLDLNADRSHPYKNLRPFANGSMQIKNGMIIFFILFLISINLSFFISFKFLVLIFLYFILSFTYSLILKKIMIIDILILAILFTFRIMGGGFATEIEISHSLLVFSIFLFLCLASIKRQSELIDLKARKKLKTVMGRGYHTKDLSIVGFIAISTAFISVVVAGLYISSPDTQVLYPKPWILWINCVVLLLWLIKMKSDSSRGLIYSDPIVYALRDNTSRLCLLIILFFFMVSIT